MIQITRKYLTYVKRSGSRTERRCAVKMFITNTGVWGFKHAIRGMRNPYESWEFSDSTTNTDIINKKDLKTCAGSIKRHLVWSKRTDCC